MMRRGNPKIPAPLLIASVEPLSVSEFLGTAGSLAVFGFLRECGSLFLFEFLAQRCSLFSIEFLRGVQLASPS